jgi:proteasome lid subunit RPN8/RPN11
MTRQHRYVLPSATRRSLHRRAYQAQQSDHAEVCGALLCDAKGQLQLVFLPNQSKRPSCWLLSTADLRGAAKAAAERGLTLLGTFHSHVVGHAVPGPRDLREGFYRGHQLIYDVCGRHAKLYRRVYRGGRVLAREISLSPGHRGAGAPQNNRMHLTRSALGRRGGPRR